MLPQPTSLGSMWGYRGTSFSSSPWPGFSPHRTFHPSPWPGWREMHRSRPGTEVPPPCQPGLTGWGPEDMKKCHGAGVALSLHPPPRTLSLCGYPPGHRTEPPASSQPCRAVGKWRSAPGGDSWEAFTKLPRCAGHGRAWTEPGSLEGELRLGGPPHSPAAAQGRRAANADAGGRQALC